MKKPASKGKRAAPQRARATADEILPEYDFSNAHPNPYAERFGAAVTVVVLDADVAETFPDAQSVNEALRALAKIAKIAKRPVKRSRNQVLRRAP
jgi:hypothetical protein